MKKKSILIVFIFLMIINIIPVHKVYADPNSSKGFAEYDDEKAKQETEEKMGNQTYSESSIENEKELEGENIQTTNKQELQDENTQTINEEGMQDKKVQTIAKEEKQAENLQTSEEENKKENKNIILLMVLIVIVIIVILFIIKKKK